MDIQKVLEIFIHYLDPQLCLYLRLVCKSFTSDNFNYLSRVTLSDSFLIANKDGLSEFIKKQIAKFDRIINLSLIDCWKLKDCEMPIIYNNIYSLNLSYSVLQESNIFSELKCFRYVHTLNLSNTVIKNTAILARQENIYDLNLANTSIQNVSQFGGITCKDSTCPYKLWNKNHSTLHMFDISNNNIIDLSALKNIVCLTANDISAKDVSMLDKLYKLSIANNVVYGLYALTKIHELNLTKVTSIESTNGIEFYRGPSMVIVFSYIHTLNLKHTNVTDLSHLSNLDMLYSLDISHTSVADISVLGQKRCTLKSCVHQSWNEKHSSLHILNLESCPFIKDVSSLANICYLNLGSNSQLDISGLCNVYDLDVSGCQDIYIRPLLDKIINFATTYNIGIANNRLFDRCIPTFKPHKLNLCQTKFFSTVSFNDIYELDLSHTDILCIKYIAQKECTDKFCPYALSYEHHNKIHILNLSNTQIEDFSPVKNVLCLNLSNTRVTDASIFSKAYKLNLSRTKVTNVSMLSSVHTLILRNVYATDFSMLGNVYELDLSYTNVGTTEGLGNVRKLNLAHTNINDISNLLGVHILDISYTNVTSILPLKSSISLKQISLCGIEISDKHCLVGVKIIPK